MDGSREKVARNKLGGLHRKPPGLISSKSGEALG
jgi:hypothetical protein